MTLLAKPSSLRSSNKWRNGVLADLVFFQRGFDITQAAQVDGPFPVISSSGVTSYHNEYMVEGPGVIIGRKGTLGSVHFSSGPFWPHDTTLWSKQLNGNDPRYVYHFMRSLDLRRFNVGNANPTLNRNHIHDLKILIPDLPTQRRIAEILSAYDDLIENNQRRMKLLEESARLLYEEWFVRLRFPGHEHTKIVDGIPEGWDNGCVADFFETSSGGTPSRKIPEYFSGDINWVKTQELGEGFIFSTGEKITREAIAQSSAKLFPASTVIVAMYGATIGEVGILAEPAATNQACCAILPSRELDEYPYIYLFVKESKQKLVNLSQGAAQNNISQRIVREFSMVYPAKNVMREFLRFTTPNFEQLSAIQQQNQKLRTARDLLLPRLMNGEIEV